MECREEYPIVRRTRIAFHFDAINAEDVELLPIMETDVTLDNPKESKRIILDAKYYQEMFVSRFGVSKNLRTDHILRFCTVDLGQDWRQIDQRLRQIIQF